MNHDAVVLAWLALAARVVANIRLYMINRVVILNCNPTTRPSGWKHHIWAGAYVCLMTTYIDLSDGNVNHATHNN